MQKIIKNKNALSEIVSYVLLIVIALAVASAVFAWLRFYVPSENERASCPENIAIYVKSYSCDSTLKILNLTLQNKGMFNIDGFLIRASNDSNKKPLTPLNSTDPNMIIFGMGKYDFTITNLAFSPQDERNVNFNYNNLGSIKKIQIQPYVYPQNQTKKSMVLCQNTVEINLDNCN